MSNIAILARDERCIMTVDALDGGRWLSTLRPGGAQPAAQTGSGSWPERTGLLAYANITAENGVFEAVNLAASRGVATKLDFRNRNSSFTLVCKAMLPRHQPDGKCYTAILLSQGDAYWGSAIYLVCSLHAYEDFRNAEPIYRLCTRPGAYLEVPATFFGNEHVLALVASATENYTRTYIDGNLFYEHKPTTSLFPLTDAPATQDNKVIKIGSQTSSLYFSEPKISSALIYDAALSTSEIAAISNML